MIRNLRAPRRMEPGPRPLRATAAVMALGLVLLTAVPANATPWRERIDRLVRGHSIGVSIKEGGSTLYAHDPRTRRVPASNEKLLLSMATLAVRPPGSRIRSRVVSSSRLGAGGRAGNLWLLGRGDPTLTGGGPYARRLPLKATRLGVLARRLKRAGVERVSGSIIGSKTYFTRDWWARGWLSYFPSQEVPLPSALTFNGNVARGTHISDPELRAARSLTRKLEALGVPVDERARTGRRPRTPITLAAVRSAPLEDLLRHMNRSSSNFFAEQIGKALGAWTRGRPGTIAKGAAAIEGYARRMGVHIAAYDSSGLSYDNRISPRGMTRLLAQAERRKWGASLRRSLARAGQGTLEGRLSGVRVRAKTGTLSYRSALSGWIWLERSRSWAEFSILSRDMYKSTAADIEDRIVRIVARYASAP